TPQFENIRSHLRSLPPAPSTEEATKNPRAGRDTSNTPDRRPDPRRVAAPSSRTTAYDEGGLFKVSVPSNWTELSNNNSVTFAPEGGYGTLNGSSVFTNGIEIGLARNEAHDLRTATDELIQSLQ